MVYSVWHFIKGQQCFFFYQNTIAYLVICNELKLLKGIKKRNVKKVQLLALHKITTNKLYGGINDDGDDESGPNKPVKDTPRNNGPNDHTRGCVSWNIACWCTKCTLVITVYKKKFNSYL